MMWLLWLVLLVVAASGLISAVRTLRRRDSRSVSGRMLMTAGILLPVWAGLVGYLASKLIQAVLA